MYEVWVDTADVAYREGDRIRWDVNRSMRWQSWYEVGDEKITITTRDYPPVPCERMHFLDPGSPVVECAFWGCFCTELDLPIAEGEYFLTTRELMFATLHRVSYTLVGIREAQNLVRTGG
jgi:hypothetical protein